VDFLTANYPGHGVYRMNASLASATVLATVTQ